MRAGTLIEHVKDHPSRRALGGDLGRYAIGSAVSLATILSVSALLHEAAGLASTVAVAIALAAALVINFTMMRAFVFPGQSLSRPRQFLETVATSVSFRGLEYVIFLALHVGVGVGYLGATTLAVSVSALSKFVVYRQLVFNRARGASGGAARAQPRSSSPS